MALRGWGEENMVMVQGRFADLPTPTNPYTPPTYG